MLRRSKAVAPPVVSFVINATQRSLSFFFEAPRSESENEQKETFMTRKKMFRNFGLGLETDPIRSDANRSKCDVTGRSLKSLRVLEVIYFSLLSAIDELGGVVSGFLRWFQGCGFESRFNWWRCPILEQLNLREKTDGCKNRTQVLSVASRLT